VIHKVGIAFLSGSNATIFDLVQLLELSFKQEHLVSEILFLIVFKMDGTVGDFDYSVHFPRELWIAILNGFSFRDLWRLRSVSLYWQELVYGAVTGIDGMSSKWLCDSHLKHCVSLTSLCVSTNVITDDGISSLLSLQSLGLNCNFRSPLCRITDVGLAKLTNLTRLTLDYNPFMTDCGISTSLRLRFLSLDGNKSITNDGLAKLTALTTLYLRNNATITDDGIKGLTNLTSLYLRGNEITNDGISRLTNLTYLDFPGIALITDDGVSLLTNLKCLDLDLEEVVPHAITNASVSRLTNLTELRLKHNESITDEALSLLANLDDLDLSDNELITNIGISRRTWPR
jgi:hypothetical protein